MLKNLFSSKARIEILKLFLFNSDNTFYQKQIADNTKQPIMAVQREVHKLLSLGLIEKSVSGNRVYYRINKECPIFEEIKGIFLKFEGISEVLKQSFPVSKKIKIAFIYGSYAKNIESSSSDIDLFVIGNISSRELSSMLSKPKQQLKREINYIVMPEYEFKNKIRLKDHFISHILTEKKIYLVGNNNELKTIFKSK